MRLIDADAVVEQADKEREYLKARGLLGAEHVLTKYLRNLVEDAPTVEIESPVIKINVPEEEVRKLLEELQKPQKVLVLPEPEVESVRLQGDWIRLDLAKRVIAKFEGYLDEDMIARIQIALELAELAELRGEIDG